jgi:hypothetical protein
MGIGFLMIILFWFGVFYLYKTAYKSFKRWDVETVTAADFTVEYKIKKIYW